MVGLEKRTPLRRDGDNSNNAPQSAGSSRCRSGVIGLEFPDTDVFHVSAEHCVSFLDPLIASWEVDLATFALKIILTHRAAARLKRFEHVQRGPSAEEPTITASFRVFGMPDPAARNRAGRSPGGDGLSGREQAAQAESQGAELGADGPPGEPGPGSSAGEHEVPGVAVEPGADRDLAVVEHALDAPGDELSGVVMPGASLKPYRAARPGVRIRRSRDRRGRPPGAAAAATTDHRLQEPHLRLLHRVDRAHARCRLPGGSARRR